MPRKGNTNSDSYLKMYSQMVKIRSFEDQANQLYLDAKMPGLTAYVFWVRKPWQLVFVRL